MFFFFNDTATTEIYTLSLHDALPICALIGRVVAHHALDKGTLPGAVLAEQRSEEHTSELQSRPHLVCRLLLEKKKILEEAPVPTRTSATRTLPDVLPDIILIMNAASI